MKRQKKFLVTYLWTFTWDLIVWAAVLFVWLLQGKRLHWINGMWCELRRDCWLHRVWGYGGVCLGHGGFYAPDASGELDKIDTAVEFHEHTHVEQVEVSLLVAFLVQLAVVLTILLSGGQVVWWVHISLWTLGWLISYGCSCLQAWLRGEDGYMGNIYEESAYSQTEDYSEDSDE